MISYNPLWKTLIDKDMTREQLRIKAGLSSRTMARMSRGESVNLTTVEKICTVLGCGISDVVEIRTA